MSASARRLTVLIVGAALVLVVPLVAMQVSDEVNWTLGDFIFMGLLLAVPIAVFEVAARRSSSLTYRAGMGIALVSAFLLTWATGAVGVIGNENNPANLMFVGVIAVVVAGAWFARFSAHGMERALIATALAQVLVGATALALSLGASGHSYPWDIVGATAFFAVLWLISAALFRAAGPGRTAVGTAS
jgi:hypothetical protein